MRRLLPTVLLAAACSTPTAAPPLRHLERPGDVAFGCITTVLLDGVNTTVALPPTSCPGVTTDAGPTGQLTAFVLEPVRGDVAVVSNPGFATFVDSDKFAPGQNGLPVGRLPTAITTSADGCVTVVANGGSCDLSLVDVVDAILARGQVVTRRALSNAAGVLAARPTMVVSRENPYTRTPSECEVPSGQVYVAFEGCHLVARVNLASGAILDGVQSLPGEQPKLVGPEVSCPVECGATAAPDLAAARPQEADAGETPIVDAGVADAGVSDARPAADAGPPPPAVPVRPSALAIEPDGSRLYAGDVASGSLLIIDLDPAGAPTAARQVPLEGAGGITRIAASGAISMGNNGATGTFRFVYAVGSDAAIHVIDVTPTRAPRECDTQIDRRYLRDFPQRDRLACFPVGNDQNPPRRAEARGPGIRLPRDVVPLDVTFIHGAAELAQGTQPTPSSLFGVFAMVTANGPVADSRVGRGLVYIINVDDDNYDDSESNESETEDKEVALAIPHALRDAVTNRRFGSTGCDEPEIANGSSGPTRVSSDVRLGGFTYADDGVPGDAFAPGLHRVKCDDLHAPYEMAVTAPNDLRETLFADLERSAVRSVLGGTPSDEVVIVEWEGTLTFDELQSQRRGGKLTELDSSRLELSAPGGLLCTIGARDGDIVRLVGCNADVDCAPGEVCVTHPDAPSGVNGLCVLDKNARDVAAMCRQLLVSLRRYTVSEVGQDRAVLLARPAVLPASPIEGCISDDQCEDIEKAILARVEADSGLMLPRHQYACEVDPGIGGVPLCLSACTTDADCDVGSVCAGERCVLGPVPPPECIATLQRYEFRSGDSFIVKSSIGDFGHRQVVEPGTGRCVEDPTQSAFLENRIPRLAPDCTDLGPVGAGPNPCRIPDLMEPWFDPDRAIFDLRPAYGMRIRSPGITFDLTDVAFPLEEANNVLVSNIPSGYGLRFNVAGGFMPYSFTLGAALPERIKLGPDGVAWVIDSGDLNSGLIQGQVLFVRQVGVEDLRLR